MRLVRQLAAAAAAVMVAASMAAAQSVNFSGTWELDASKSNLGPMGGGPNGPPKITMVVEHKDPALAVKTTTETPMGTRTAEQKFTTDGKESVNTGPMGNQTKAIVTWKDKTTLQNDGTATMRGGMEMKVHQEWTLSPDGKTLTITRTMSGQMGEMSMSQVFTKAN